MWFAAIFIFVLAEILTTNFVFLSFAVAAISGIGVKLLGGGTPLQWVIVALVSVISLRFIRPSALKRLYNKSDKSGSWIENLIGMEGTALTEITHESGQVRVHSETWTAYSTHNSLIIETGSPIRVERINGAILSVSPISNSQVSK